MRYLDSPTIQSTDDKTRYTGVKDSNRMAPSVAGEDWEA